MIFHASISARNPRVVAGVIAELWRGKAFPFPPAEGGWIAFAGDERGTAIEVLPIGAEMVLGEGDRDEVQLVPGVPRLNSATHLAIATPLTETHVRAIAMREGWPVKRFSRGGLFDVLEFWAEGMILLEVLTAEMQRDYARNITIEGWGKFLGEAPAARATPAEQVA